MVFGVINNVLTSELPLTCSCRNAIGYSCIEKLVWKRDKGRDFSSFSQWRHWKERVKYNYFQSSAWEENYWEDCWMQRVGWEWHSQTRGMLENPTFSFPQLPAFNWAILGKVFQFLLCKISLNWLDCHVPLQTYSGCLVLFLILRMWWELFQLPVDTWHQEVLLLLPV